MLEQAQVRTEKVSPKPLMDRVAYLESRTDELQRRLDLTTEWLARLYAAVGLPFPSDEPRERF